MTGSVAYHQLEKRFSRYLIWGEVRDILQWDSAVMMPPGGAGRRAEQMAALASLCHGEICHPAVAELLAQAEEDMVAGEFSDWQRANVAEMRRLWRHAVALDRDLVEALSRASSACETVWRQARREADFAAVLPSLQTLLGLVRQVAAAKGEALGVSPYEGLLDDYEPGGSTVHIDALFGELEAVLPDLVVRVVERQAARPRPLALSGPFDEVRQKALGQRLMTAMGFDFSGGRLDVSAHPFCGGVPEDLRLTTRYDSSQFSAALMGILHETGHALYERGLPQRWRGQPVGLPRGMSIHESQSLLMEMQVCRSLPFFRFAAPLIAEAFEASGPAWQAENLYRLHTQVRPSLIRVEADEVTYPAHVILRYRLERALIAGDLSAAELPAAWNEGLMGLLGIKPDNDRTGCLQDIHWYEGAWGYFPTYTLGALTAAQLYQAATGQRPEIPEAIARGDFSPLLAWLGEQVHAQGSRLSNDQLIRHATGKPLGVAAFVSHLENRYL